MRPHTGASPLTCRSDFEICPVFRGNDLLALMLNCLCHSALDGGGFIETALPLRSRGTRDPTIAATVAVARLWMLHCVVAFVPFIWQFCDLRVALERGDFSGEEASVFGDGFHGHTIGFHTTHDR